NEIRGLFWIQQPLRVDRGVAVEAFGPGAGNQAVKLPVAVLVHREDGLVELLAGLRGCHVRFNAEDRLDLRLLSSDLELNVARGVSVLCERESVHSELLGSVDVVSGQLMAVAVRKTRMG